MADRLPADLARVDPADAWKPWQPAPADWNRKWVAHLYRRAAFGPSAADTDAALKDGFAKTLDRLLAGEPDAPERLELLTDTGRLLRHTGGTTTRFNPVNENQPDPREVQIRGWWLYAMQESGHPLREKLTLFWHNHFATSNAKVRNPGLMLEQNLTLRRHALGKFRPFLLDMSRDTAMLVWLDSNRNTKGVPNENYAREVMELFSLGVGNYSEKDVQEAARAFTGWHHDPEVTTFEFNDDVHDAGAKTVLGQTGNWKGEDIVRICCDQPACARFLVGKLYAYLVSETPPPKGLLTPLEDRFRKSDCDIADLVRAVLGSRLFFSDHAYRKRVKWPVECVLGAARAVVPSRVPPGDLAVPLGRMGQSLFAPPNVKGWRTGTDWLNSATLLARNNYAEAVAMGNWSAPRQNTGGAVFAAPTATAKVEAVEVAAAPDLAEPEPYVQPATGAALGAAGAVALSMAPAAPGISAPVPVPTPTPAPPPGTPGVARNVEAKPATSKGPPAQFPTPPADRDPLGVVFATKPTTVQSVVRRMGELLFGEELPPAARTKIEKYLLGGKSAVAEKDIDTPAFRHRVREAMHAMMCLPDYQLN